MTRPERLSQILQILRQPGPAITEPQLASLFGTTVKTICRDIELLRSQGFIPKNTDDSQLQPVTAPAASFTQDELEAIVLGLSWVSSQDDSPLSVAANAATAKIEAMLPPPPGKPPAASIGSDSHDPLDIIRAAILSEHRLHLEYCDAKGRASSRIVWPIELDAYDDTGMIAAWCEHRDDFRNFRVDRIQSLALLDRYPVRRQTLLAKLQLQQDDDPFY